MPLRGQHFPFASRSKKEEKMGAITAPISSIPDCDPKEGSARSIPGETRGGNRVSVPGFLSRTDSQSALVAGASLQASVQLAVCLRHLADDEQSARCLLLPPPRLRPPMHWSVP